MKAVRINKFGGTEVLKIQETERPVPAADEILVKVYASGVNPIDCKIRDGAIVDKLHVKIELPITPGWDTAGIVEEVGSEVTAFKTGDAVYGIPNYPGDGSYAEYVATKASKFALKPKSISFNQAGGMSVSSVTAWDGVVRCGQIKVNQRILIHGAAGGVGHIAVQLAKWKGAYVIGVASESQREFLKQLGVDEFIDYKSQKFEDLVGNVDVVFDAASLGEPIHLKSAKVLKENGVLVTTQGFPLTEKVIQALTEKNAEGKVIYGEEDLLQQWLNQIAQLIDENKLRINIRNIYPFEQAADAHLDCESGNGYGKIVLEIRKED